MSSGDVLSCWGMDGAEAEQTDCTVMLGALQRHRVGRAWAKRLSANTAGGFCPCTCWSWLDA